MPEEGADNSSLPEGLLAADEPKPFEILNPDARAPIILICDHASRRFPKALGTMGLDPFARQCHLAVDIGAGPLTEALANQLGVTAVLCQYSRLVVDCNRELMDPGAFLEYGDGVVIPGNKNLHRADKESRAQEIYWPYHHAIDEQLDRLREQDIRPVFVSIHSFTPVLNGESRSWEMGVLWDEDRVTAEIFVNELRAAGYLVGDNEPYSGKAPQDFTVDHHGEQSGIPHVGIEIRHDLIHHADGVKKIAEVMHNVLKSLPAKLWPTDIDSKRSG